MKSLITATDYFRKISENGVILFGAGSKARQAIEILHEKKVGIRAVCDNNPNLWGREIYPGLVIQEFNKVKKECKNCTILFTAAINNTLSIRETIEETFPCYQFCNPFKVEQCLLEDDIKKNRESIKEIYECLADKQSREIFILNLNYKLTGNMLPLVDMVSGSNELLAYFDEELFENEKRHTFVDIGAYTGDSIMSFLMATRGKYEKIIAYEVDQGNFDSLVRFRDYARVPRVELLNIALWSKCEERTLFTLSNNSNINYDSPNFYTDIDCIADNKTLKEAKKEHVEANSKSVRAQTLDSQLKNIDPTVIKVNAMADDFEILKGGAQLIKRCKPLLICEFGVKKEDLFIMIPWMRKLNPEYKFYLREKKIYKDIKTILYMK